MLRRLAWLLPFTSLSWVSGCGSDDAAGRTNDVNGAAPKQDAGALGEGGGPADASLAETPLVGLWEVSGKDERGTYVGEVEVRPFGADYAFVRAVRYLDITVEDGRALHWLFRGKLQKTVSGVSLTSSLKRLDFIDKRGGLTRTSADTPIALTGTLTASATELTASISGTGVSLTDTWKARKDLPATPIFEDKRVLVPAHDPPPTSTVQTLFALYSDFHTLDVIKPYVARAEFKSAQHGNVIDTTDLDFYRLHPDVLRVIDKPIDAISLGETRARADAFRFTLAKKAELYDSDIEQRFMDPELGMIPERGAPGGGYATQHPSGDGALWTGVYLGGQVYRHQVTGSPKAKENVVRSLEALLTLQEITSDWKQFARVLRKAQGNPQPPWRAGTGAFAHLEWMEGGNNDMIQGLFYGYLMAWELLCEGGKTGHEAQCARIRTNAKHLADDVVLGGSNAPASQLTNKLPAAWLSAVVAVEPGDKLSYQTTANGYWLVGRTVLDQTVDSAFQGQVYVSGAHLTSVGTLAAIFLAKRMNLGGDAAAKYTAYIDKTYGNIGRFRVAEWDLLRAIGGTGAGSASAVAPFVANATSRFVEAVYPKVSYSIDRRISPEFCMSPYPYLPWKNDWMTYPKADRTTGLNSHPLFEGKPDVLYWKVGNGYRADEGYETAGGDYTHLYWQARKFGLLSATE